MRETQHDWIVRKHGEAEFSAAIGHVNGLVDRRLVAGALDHVVCADAIGKLFDDTNRTLVVD